MRTSILLWLSMLLLAPVVAQDFVPDEVIVQYDYSQGDYWLFSHDVGGQDIVVVSLSGETVQDAIDRLSADPTIAFVQPNYVYTFSSLPNDPYFGYMRWLYNTWQTIEGESGLSGADIGWTQGLTLFSGIDDDNVSGTIVGVIDNGIAYNDPELINRIWDWTNCLSYTGAVLWSCLWWYDFWADDLDPHPYTGSTITGQDWHGTFVAGILWAESDNGLYIAGINPNIHLMALRAGSGRNLTTSSIINAIDFAEYNSARILNASFGGTGFDSLLYNSIAWFPGLVVAAAGNGDDLHSSGVYNVYPCDFNLANVLCVGASNQSDALASFSDYGTAYIDILAPWENITSLAFVWDTPGIISSQWWTSFAAPHVAWVASLLWSYMPTLSVTQVKDIILNYSDYLAALSGTVWSSRRVDLYGVLQAFTLSGSFAISWTPTIQDPLDIILYTDKYPAYYSIDGTGLSAIYTWILSASSGLVSVDLSPGEWYKDVDITIYTDYASWTGNTWFLVHDSVPTLAINVYSGYINYGSSFVLSGVFADGYYLSGLYINSVAYTGCNFAWSISTCNFSMTYLLSSGYHTFFVTGVDVSDNTVTTGITILIDLYDRTPDSVSFTTQTNVDRSTVTLSNIVTISGIEVPVDITVSGGWQYSINGWWFTSASSTISSGNTVQVRLTSSSSYSTSKVAYLTVGSSIFTFTVTTEAAPSGGWGGSSGGGWSSGWWGSSWWGSDTSDDTSEEGDQSEENASMQILGQDQGSYTTQILSIGDSSLLLRIPPFTTTRGLIFKSSLITLFSDKLSGVVLSKEQRENYTSAFNDFLQGIYGYMELWSTDKSQILKAFAVLKPIFVAKVQTELEMAIQYLYTTKLTVFNTVSTFRSNDYLSRQEAAKFIVSFVKNILGQSVPSLSHCSFTDVGDADASLISSILESCALGVFKWSDGKFFPFGTLTKAEAVVIVLRALDEEPARQDSVTWYKPYIERAYNLGILKSNTMDGANAPVTRGTLALLLYRAALLVD